MDNSKSHLDTYSEMLDAALEYAENGWSVFPCEDKAPAINHGHHGATRDPEVIKYWWSERPDAMIGAKVPDALLVLDIDPRNGGSLESLERVAGPMPPTLTVWSGRNDGGRHLYFIRPEGRLTSTRLPDGIDLKINGYCIVPPSIHPVTGLPYTWGDTRAIAVMPGSLRALLRALVQRRTPPRADQTSDGAGLVRSVREAKPGKRHDILVWASYRARDTGILEQIATDLISASAESGHDGTDARRVVESVGRS